MPTVAGDGGEVTGALIAPVGTIHKPKVSSSCTVRDDIEVGGTRSGQG